MESTSRKRSGSFARVLPQSHPVLFGASLYKTPEQLGDVGVDKERGPWKKCTSNLSGKNNASGFEKTGDEQVGSQKAPAKKQIKLGDETFKENSAVLYALSAYMVDAKSNIKYQNVIIQRGDSLTLGRSKSQCDIVFEDSRVSRVHCIVSFDGVSGHLILHNGTLKGCTKPRDKSCAEPHRTRVRFSKTTTPSVGHKRAVDLVTEPVPTQAGSFGGTSTLPTTNVECYRNVHMRRDSVAMVKDVGGDRSKRTGRAEIEGEGPAAGLQVQPSLNGVYVDGVRLQQGVSIVLHDGAEVSLVTCTHLGIPLDSGFGEPAGFWVKYGTTSRRLLSSKCKIQAGKFHEMTDNLAAEGKQQRVKVQVVRRSRKDVETRRASSLRARRPMLTTFTGVQQKDIKLKLRYQPLGHMSLTAHLAKIPEEETTAAGASQDKQGNIYTDSKFQENTGMAQNVPNDQEDNADEMSARQEEASAEIEWKKDNMHLQSNLVPQDMVQAINAAILTRSAVPQVEHSRHQTSGPPAEDSSVAKQLISIISCPSHELLPRREENLPLELERIEHMTLLKPSQSTEDLTIRSLDFSEAIMDELRVNALVEEELQDGQGCVGSAGNRGERLVPCDSPSEACELKHGGQHSLPGIAKRVREENEVFKASSVEVREVDVLVKRQRNFLLPSSDDKVYGKACSLHLPAGVNLDFQSEIETLKVQSQRSNSSVDIIGCSTELSAEHYPPQSQNGLCSLRLQLELEEECLDTSKGAHQSRRAEEDNADLRGSQSEKEIDGSALAVGANQGMSSPCSDLRAQQPGEKTLDRKLATSSLQHVEASQPSTLLITELNSTGLPTEPKEAVDIEALCKKPEVRLLDSNGPSHGFCLNRLEGMEQCTDGIDNGVTLEELLGPTDELEEIFAATFSLDLQWFLEYSCLKPSTPVTVAAHHYEHSWDTSEGARMACPYPEAWPLVNVLYPPFPNSSRWGPDKTRRGIGCHHPKMFLIVKKHALRVVVSSANLNRRQWLAVTNTVWWRDIPELPSADATSLFSFSTPFSSSTSLHLSATARKERSKELPRGAGSTLPPGHDFAAELAAFVAHMTADVAAQARWVVKLARYDWSKASDVALVCSVPGLLTPPCPPLLYSLASPRSPGLTPGKGAKHSGVQDSPGRGQQQHPPPPPPSSTPLQQMSSPPPPAPFLSAAPGSAEEQVVLGSLHTTVAGLRFRFRPESDPQGSRFHALTSAVRSAGPAAASAAGKPAGATAAAGRAGGAARATGGSSCDTGTGLIPVDLVRVTGMAADLNAVEICMPCALAAEYPPNPPPKGKGSGRAHSEARSGKNRAGAGAGAGGGGERGAAGGAAAKAGATGAQCEPPPRTPPAAIPHQQAPQAPDAAGAVDSPPGGSAPGEGASSQQAGRGVRMGFLPKAVAQWVAPLWDAGACSFVGRVCPQETLSAAAGQGEFCLPLCLYVVRGPRFCQLTEMLLGEGHLAAKLAPAVAGLLRSVNRPLGSWRLHQVLSRYEWPDALETDFLFGSSSVGTSLDAEFLAAFSAAAGRKRVAPDVAAAAALSSDESDPQWRHWTAKQEAEQPSMGLVYPTIERVTAGRGGPAASQGLMCFAESIWETVGPAKMMHDAVPHPPRRDGIPMHTKVGRRRFEATAVIAAMDDNDEDDKNDDDEDEDYYNDSHSQEEAVGAAGQTRRKTTRTATRRSRSRNGSGNGSGSGSSSSPPFGWVYCGSHNLSPAAWGRPMHKPPLSRTWAPHAVPAVMGNFLHILNFEMGLLFVEPPPPPAEPELERLRTLRYPQAGAGGRRGRGAEGRGLVPPAVMPSGSCARVPGGGAPGGGAQRAGRSSSTELTKGAEGDRSADAAARPVTAMAAAGRGLDRIALPYATPAPRYRTLDTPASGAAIKRAVARLRDAQMEADLRVQACQLAAASCQPEAGGIKLDDGTCDVEVRGAGEAAGAAAVQLAQPNACCAAHAFGVEESEVPPGEEEEEEEDEEVDREAPAMKLQATMDEEGVQSQRCEETYVEALWTQLDET